MIPVGDVQLRLPLALGYKSPMSMIAGPMPMIAGRDHLTEAS